jgi:hypothetical protein
MGFGIHTETEEKSSAWFTGDIKHREVSERDDSALLMSSRKTHNRPNCLFLGYKICDLYLVKQNIFMSNYQHAHGGKGGCAAAQSVEALHYKKEDRGFDSRWSHWNFSVT